MNIKNNRGVTLVSLAVYVILMLGVIAVIAAFKNNIDKTLYSMGEYTSLVPEINKMHMYMLGEANIEDNKISKRSSDGTYIEFTSGNKYMFSGDKIYKNSVRIFSDIKNCTFEMGKENNNDVLYVNLQLGDKDIVTKRLKYVMKSQNVDWSGLIGVPISTVVRIGDYVNYDAGTWTVEDLTKIISSAGNPTLHSTVNDTTTGNQALPTAQGQFGGFEIGQSRNTNSTEYWSSYKPRTAGWRVWSIEGDVVTLISAGHPETYYHKNGNSVASINILRNRNCSMYVNGYATSAHVLTGQETAIWYNTQFGTNYAIVENGGSSTSTFYRKTFTTAEPISVLENGSYYGFASAYNSNNLYYFSPDGHYVNDYCDREFRSAHPSFSKI